MFKSISVILTLVLVMATIAISPVVVTAECEVGSTDIGSCFSNGISEGNQADNGEATINLSGGLGFATLPQAIETILALVFVGAALLAFGFVIYGGITYVTAGDDSSRTNRARWLIMNALIGLVLLAVMYVLWLLVVNLVPGVGDFFNTGGTYNTLDGLPPAADCSNVPPGGAC